MSVLLERAPENAACPPRARALHLTITCAALLNGGDAAICAGVAKILASISDPPPRLSVRSMQAEAARRYRPEFAPEPMLSESILARLPRRGRRFIVPFVFPVILFLIRLFCWSCRTPLSGTISRGFPTLRSYRDTDVFVATGGTYLVPHYDQWSRLLEFRIIRALGKTLCLFPQSIGHFENDGIGARLARELGHADLIMVRDRRSRMNVERLLADGRRRPRIVVVADSAFVLSDRADVRAPIPPSTGTAPRLQVGISVRRWGNFRRKQGDALKENYIQTLAAFTQWLVEEWRAEVLFVSTCQGVPEYRFDDAALAKEIVSRLPAAVRATIRIDERCHGYSELMEIFGRMDVLVATRMHAAIFGFMAGTPVLMISYENKQNDLVAGEAVAAGSVDIEDLSGAAMRAIFRDIMGDRDRWRAHVAAFVAAQRAKAWSAKDAFERWVVERSPSRR